MQKTPFFKNPIHFLFIGLSGLILCALLLLYIEFGMQAPNESTLFYQQSKALPGVVILFVVSVVCLFRWAQLKKQA
jgi:hypothetical protein